MHKLFDSHAHYYDSRFDEVEGGVDALLHCLFDGEVGGIVNVGTDLENAHAVIESAARFENMYAAVGIHPSDGQAYRDIPAAMAELRAIFGDAENRRAKKIVALGEIGLDYHYPDTDKPHQVAFFEEQLKLAEELDLPVIIHDREAHGDVLDVIRSFPGVRGVLHSYSGSYEMAKELVLCGYMISFSGTLTFTNAKKVREVAIRLPKESVLIETDAPYLTPHPNRGKLNHSGYLEYTNRTLAELFNLSEEECASLTDENARRFFGI